MEPTAPAGSGPDLEVESLGRWSLFVRSYRFWRNPILVACVAALVLGAIGVYVILRRVVFATACLANVSGVGVALGALIGLDPHALEHSAETHHWYEDIVGLFGFSLLFTAVLAAAFAWWRESKRMSRESLLGFVYVVSGALLVLLASQLNQSTHAIDDIVFGSAVVVERSQVIIVPLFAALLLIVHIVFNKDFLFASFDPVAARAAHYPVRLLDTLLFVTIGLAIATGTRAIGAMPVFSFVVLPPLTALMLTDRIRLVFFLAPIFGVLGAATGYMTAFMLKLPVGPSMTLCCALLLGLASLRRLGRGSG
jgi:zinc transport system permease protein